MTVMHGHSPDGADSDVLGVASEVSLRDSHDVEEAFGYDGYGLEVTGDGQMEDDYIWLTVDGFQAGKAEDVWLARSGGCN